MAPKLLDKLKSLPELRDVATDQQTAGTTLTLTINRDQAARYGLTPQMIDDTLYDAFGQREIAQYFTQLASYYVIMEVLPSLQGNPATLDQIFLRSPTTGGEVPLSAFAKWTTAPIAPLSISHQGQVPGDHHQLQPGAGHRAGAGDERNRASNHRAQCLPATIIRTFQGNAQAFPGFALDGADADPRRARLWSTSFSAFSTRASSTRSPFSRPCRRRASARWRR